MTLPALDDDLLVAGLQEIHRLPAPQFRSRVARQLQQAHERAIGPDHPRVGLMEQGAAVGASDAETPLGLRRLEEFCLDTRGSKKR